MGAGSSKKSQPPPKKTAPPKPVANVNNQEQRHENGASEVNHAPQKDIDKTPKKREENEMLNKKQEKEKEKNKKMKIDEREKENMITYEDESDMDNDIDEVLKIPMAIEYPKPKKKDKKDKNKKNEEIMNYDSKLDRDLFHSNSNGYSRKEDLPETYAQRLQRQQYKLQQDLLIRQKTMHRNAKEWDDLDDEEDENLTNTGFDASKFRAANKGGDAKKDLFTTSSGQEDVEAPTYFPADQDMDDFHNSKRTASPSRNLPSYNQSEIDLMQELERDLL